MVDTPAIVVFSDDHKAKLRELVSLAGLDIRSDALDSILNLLSLGAAPNSLATVLSAISKPPGVGLAHRQYPIPVIKR
jgi:hypothetical protein